MANLLEGGGDVSAVHEYLERGLGKFIYGQGIIISPSSTIKKDGQSGVGDGGAPAHPTVRCSRAKAAMIVASMSSSRMASMAAARKSLLRWSRPGRRLMMTAVNAVMTAMVPSSVAMESSRKALDDDGGEGDDGGKGRRLMATATVAVKDGGEGGDGGTGMRLMATTAMDGGEGGDGGDGVGWCQQWRPRRR